MEPPTISPCTKREKKLVTHSSIRGLIRATKTYNARHQNINRLSNPPILLILLHIESLELSRESIEENWPVNDIRHAALSSLSDVVAKDMGVALLVEDGGFLLVEPINSVRVLHSQEGTGLLKGRVQKLQNSSRGLVGQDLINYPGNKVLNVLEEVLKLDKVELGLDVRVFGQVATGKRALGAERLLDAVNVAEGLDSGLEVELRGLGEVGFLAVVVIFEKGRTTLDLGLHHSRRRNLGKVELTIRINKRKLNILTQLHDRRGILSSEHKVPAIKHRRLPWVLVAGDLVGHGLQIARCSAQDLVVINVELTSIGGLGALGNLLHLSVEDKRRLLRKDERIVGLGQVACWENALQEAVSVSEGDEGRLLLDAKTVDAAKNLYAGAELDLLVIELDPDGGGEALVLLENDLLGIFEVLNALLALLLLLCTLLAKNRCRIKGVMPYLLCRSTLLGQLLLISVDTALCLLDGALCGLLPGRAVSRSLLRRDEGEVGWCGRGLEVLDQGMVERVVRSGLGAICWGLVLAGDGVDVDLCL